MKITYFHPEFLVILLTLCRFLAHIMNLLHIYLHVFAVNDSTVGNGYQYSITVT